MMEHDDMITSCHNPYTYCCFFLIQLGEIMSGLKLFLLL